MDKKVRWISTALFYSGLLHQQFLRDAWGNRNACCPDIKLLDADFILLGIQPGLEFLLLDGVEGIRT